MCLLNYIRSKVVKKRNRQFYGTSQQSRRCKREIIHKFCYPLNVSDSIEKKYCVTTTQNSNYDFFHTYMCHHRSAISIMQFAAFANENRFSFSFRSPTRIWPLTLTHLSESEVNIFYLRIAYECFSVALKPKQKPRIFKIIEYWGMSMGYATNTREREL